MNEGHSTGIMEACETLAGYSHLIELTRSFAQVMSLADAIEAAIEQCIEEGSLDLSTASQLFGIPEEEIRVTLEKLFNKSPSSDEG